MDVGLTAPPVTHDAAVDDEQVSHIVGPAPAVHDGGGAVGTHARRAHQVPSRGLELGVDRHVPGPGRFHQLRRPVDAVGHHPQAVFTDGVLDLRCGDAVAVRETGVERDAVVGLGEVLAEYNYGDRMAQPVGHDTVVSLSPGDSVPGPFAQGRGHRTQASYDLKAVASREAPGQVRLVELVAKDRAAARACVAVRGLLEEPR